MRTTETVRSIGIKGEKMRGEVKEDGQLSNDSEDSRSFFS
jgi:hypothetical protein